MAISTANRVATMQYRPGTGWSEAPSHDGQSSGTLILAFGAPQFGDDPAPFEALAGRFPGAIIVGCSTAGEILGDELHDGTISAGLFRFEQTMLARAEADVDDPSESRAAGQALGAALSADDLRAVLVFSDGLRVNGSELVRGLGDSLGDEVSISGGLAGDGTAFARTWVLRAGRPGSGGVVAVGLYGDRVLVRSGCNGGWEAFGPPRVVTRAEGNVLYELDGTPALPLYKDYLGDKARELPASALFFPLALDDPEDDREFVVRTVVSVDEARQAMVFAGDVPTGASARLMRTNFDRLVTGAALSGHDASATMPHDVPWLGLAVSGVGRRLVLRQRTEEELEVIGVQLPPDSGLVGFYAYAEIAPGRSGPPRLHNQTMALTVIAEA